MSTAGKVLVVLVLLVVPVWILLVSTVAQLNNEWTQALKKQTDQIATLEQDVEKNEREIQKLKNDIGLTQDAADLEETVSRAKLAEVERAKGDTIQTQTGVNFELETLKATVKEAEAARVQRNAELQAEQTAKAAAEKRVATLKQENTQLMDELGTLRQDFKATLEENRKLVDRLQKAAPARPARRTSFAR